MAIFAYVVSVILEYAYVGERGGGQKSPNCAQVIYDWSPSFKLPQKKKRGSIEKPIKLIF